MSPVVQSTSPVHRSSPPIVYSLFCVDFAIKEGQPDLDLEVANGSHVWTPVQVMKPNVLSDELVEPHAIDIPVSELSKLDSIEYCCDYQQPAMYIGHAVIVYIIHYVF